MRSRSTAQQCIGAHRVTPACAAGLKQVLLLQVQLTPGSCKLCGKAFDVLT